MYHPDRNKSNVDAKSKMQSINEAYSILSNNATKVTYTDTGEKKSFGYKIEIVGVPSNLGRGELLYFICPVTGEKCRVLYKAYGSDTWQSRKAYFRPIYYDLQQCSKLDRYNTKYWILERELTDICKKRTNSTYRGNKTKTAIRNEKRYKELEHMDNLRWSPAGMPKSLWPFAKEMGYGSAA